MVLRAVCLCFLLQVWGDHCGVYGAGDARIDLENDYLNKDAWDLVEAGNKAITFLTELSNGVFSIELVAVRSDCETGTGFLLFIFGQTDALHSICIMFWVCLSLTLLLVLLQSIWVSTTGPVPQHCPPNQPLGQSCAVPVKV